MLDIIKRQYQKVRLYFRNRSIKLAEKWIVIGYRISIMYPVDEKTTVFIFPKSSNTGIQIWTSETKYEHIPFVVLFDDGEPTVKVAYSYSLNAVYAEDLSRKEKKRAKMEMESQNA